MLIIMRICVHKSTAVDLREQGTPLVPFEMEILNQSSTLNPKSMVVD
jgi:hypothetical protein